jgi:hypothetical protein
MAAILSARTWRSVNSTESFSEFEEGLAPTRQLPDAPRAGIALKFAVDQSHRESLA